LHQKDVRLPRPLATRQDLQGRREMAEGRKLRDLRMFALFQRELRQNLQYENRQTIGRYICLPRRRRKKLFEEMKKEFTIIFIRREGSPCSFFLNFLTFSMSPGSRILLSRAKRPYSIFVDSNIRHLVDFVFFFSLSLSLGKIISLLRHHAAFFLLFLCLERFYRSVFLQLSVGVEKSLNSFCM